MSQKSFNPHSRILHDGQYEIKKRITEVPIRTFLEQSVIEKNVTDRIDELRTEISELEEQIKEKRRINQEKADHMLAKVQEEAKRVLEEAEQHAFDRIQKSVKEKESVLLQTTEEADKIKIQAERDAQEIIQNAEKESVKLKDIAQKEGYDQGLVDGFNAAKKDVDFALERLHGVVAETARERERILVHSETQVINLVLTMVKKVVKKLTVEHQDVVIENIKAALELLRGAMTIFIHVSPHDYNYASSFREELIRSIESRSDVKFIEDPTVEPGGVYIETDTGDVDATIRSQLEELETQMHFYMPVKVKSPESKRREQERIDSLQKEQDNLEKKEEKLNLPKTKFAQREEFSSNSNSYRVSDTVEQNAEILNSEKPEVIEPVVIDSSEQSKNYEQDTEIVPEIINEQKPSVSGIDTGIILDAYAENKDNSETQEPHDDITV